VILKQGEGCYSECPDLTISAKIGLADEKVGIVDITVPYQKLKQHDPGRVPRGFRRKTAAYFTYASSPDALHFALTPIRHNRDGSLIYLLEN
jgi:hypothetical protein